VAILNQLELEPETNNTALKLIRNYIVEYGKAKELASANGGRLSSVTARQLKGTLDAGLAELLSPEELARWSESSAFRGASRTQTAQQPGGVERKPGQRKKANRDGK
jgi:hypothetical protein